MQRFWAKKIRASAAYVPGEQPRDRRYIKLNTNESPYPPAPAVAAALREFDCSALRLYPDPSQGALRAALAAYHGLEGPTGVFVGNGSDEVLAFAFQAFFDPAAGGDAAPVLTPEPGYGFYPVYARFFDIPLEQIPLAPDFSVALEDYRRRAQGVVLANPNAPTGLALSRAQIRELLEQDRARLLLLDEAYADFAEEDALSLLGDYDNLLIVRTFSKSRALAGMRLGYALGAPELILALERVRDHINSYTVNRLTECLALAALRDEDYFRDCCAKIKATRRRCTRILADAGCALSASSANFLWLRHPRVSAAEAFFALREAGILVRHFAAPPCCRDYLRVTLGSDAEMDAFLSCFLAL